MENLVARRLRTVLANEIEGGMEHNLSHQLSEDKPLYLSPDRVPLLWTSFADRSIVA